MITSALCLLAAAVVMWRTLHVIASLDIHKFAGRAVQFWAIAAHSALVGAGAVAVALNVAIGGPLLLTGVAILIVADRRRTPWGKHDHP